MIGGSGRSSGAAGDERARSGTRDEPPVGRESGGEMTVARGGELAESGGKSSIESFVTGKREPPPVAWSGRAALALPAPSPPRELLPDFAGFLRSPSFSRDARVCTGEDARALAGAACAPAPARLSSTSAQSSSSAAKRFACVRESPGGARRGAFALAGVRFVLPASPASSEASLSSEGSRASRALRESLYAFTLSAVRAGERKRATSSILCSCCGTRMRHGRVSTRQAR